MFGFGEVRTHLRAVSMMFMDYFGFLKGSHAATWPRRKNGLASGSPQRSHCSQHGKLLCLCFVLLFRCSEDLSIGLMRTL